MHTGLGRRFARNMATRIPRKARRHHCRILDSRIEATTLGREDVGFRIFLSYIVLRRV